MLISKYRVELKDDPQFAGLNFEEKQARLLRCKLGLTTTYVQCV